MKPKVDNFNLIRPLLKWEKEGEFYYVQLLLRLKDKTTTFSNKNNSARCIKSYVFYTLEQFNSKEIEIKKLCDIFCCRAGIQINKLTDEAVAKELAKRAVDAIISRNYHINGVLESIWGSNKYSKERNIIIDVDDTKDENFVKEIIDVVNSLQPLEVKNKILQVVKTFSGFHIICSKFKKEDFEKFCTTNKNVSYKGNLAALYYPEII